MVVVGRVADSVRTEPAAAGSVVDGRATGVTIPVVATSTESGYVDFEQAFPDAAPRCSADLRGRASSTRSTADPATPTASPGARTVGHPSRPSPVGALSGLVGDRRRGAASGGAVAFVTRVVVLGPGGAGCPS